MNTMMTTLTQQLDHLQETAQTYIEALATPAQLLCGLFAFAYIGYRLWSTWAKGQQIDFYGLIKPFAVGLTIVFFSAFTAVLDLVVYPIDVATQQMAEQMAVDYTQSQNTYRQALKEVRNNMAAYERNNGQELNSSEADSSPISVQLQTYQTTLQMLCNLFQVALSGAVLFIKVFVVMAKLVLLLVGPFAFALSLLPHFEGNIATWATHYVRILLYMPLCALVSSLVAVLFSMCLYPSLIQMLSSLPASNFNLTHYQQAAAYQLTGYSIQLLFYGIAIALYACIPTFSKWILSAGARQAKSM